MTTAVYFLRADRSGAIKIGMTGHFDTRLAQIRTASPEPISVVGVVAADKSLEQSLHAEFAASRLSGEWFEPTDALLERIARILQDQTDFAQQKPLPADDEHTMLASKWLRSIEDGEALRRGVGVAAVRAEIAESLGLTAGYLENLRRGRKNHPVYARDFAAIKAAYINELLKQADDAKRLIAQASPAEASKANSHLTSARQILAGEVK